MKVRYTIRDMLLLALLVALAVGWLSDHRREEEVIKLQAATEQRQEKLIQQTQGTLDIIGGVLKSQFQRIQGTEAAIKMLKEEVRAHYTPTDQSNSHDVPATQ